MKNTENEDIVLVNDISCSMGADDWEPSRLEGVKKASLAFLESRAKRYPDDWLGIVAFDDTAEVILPLTEISRQSLIAQKIDELDIRGFTSIGAGLNMAKEVLKSARRGSAKRVIVYTDGDENSDPPAPPIAEKLKKNGVVIFTIGIGGSPDDVNEDLLKRIASVIDGKPAYRFIGDADSMVKHYRQLAETRLIRWGGR